MYHVVQVFDSDASNARQCKITMGDRRAYRVYLSTGK